MNSNLHGEWFEEWFDTPYYHILYKERDQQEAALFIDRLIDKLDMKRGQQVLDLACGKGRHSIYLSQKGFSVVGVDLSSRSIEEAKKFENENLKFKVHDMRKEIRIAHYDFIFNLFTSFGYFDSEEENLQTLNSVVNGLKADGIFVIDFMNIHFSIEHLNKKETKTLEGIRFEISKRLEDGFLFKDIKFEDEGRSYHFIERLMSINYQNFLDYFEKVGLKAEQTFGDYFLNNYDENTSERLIFVCTKK